MHRPSARSRSRRAGAAAAVLALGVLLSGCGGTGYTPAGPFRPLPPQGAPPEVGPPGGSTAAPAPSDPAQPQSGQQAGDADVVATGLSVPTGLVVLPDGSAIVGERSTGRLLHVFPDRSPAQVLMTVPGLDTTGDGGLLGLALSPTYSEDQLLFAYISTATDNRVVRFPIGGTPNPVLTGIPHGASRNGGGLVFGADGSLYVGTGDTGNAGLAQDPSSLAGKVLRVDEFGHPVGGSSPVYASGLADVTALCQGADQKIFATDDGASGGDALEKITSGGDYGWPNATATTAPPVHSFPAGQGALGGCAVGDAVAYVGSLDGQRVDVQKLTPAGRADGDPTDVLAGKYGRLRTTVLDADGGLWITTSNRDGAGTPAADDDKVLRIVPPTSSGNSPL